MIYGRMRMLNTFFVHWRVPVAQLQPRLPPGLKPDLFDGNAYVSQVGLGVIGPVPFSLPLPVGRFFSYYQFNTRTYVTDGSRRGIFLLRTLVNKRLPALGGRLLGMPYNVAADLDLAAHGGSVSLRAPGLEICGEVEDTDPAPAQAGSLESFLTDRFRVYSRLPCGLVFGIHIEHAPWLLRPVRLTDSLPSSVTGIDGAVPVAAHLAEDIDVELVGVALV